MIRDRCWLIPCLAVFAGLCLGTAYQESATFDEAVHMTCGYAFWKTGSYTYEPVHPPVLRLWMSLPLLAMPLNFPRQPPDWAKNALYDFSNLVINQPQVPVDLPLHGARCMVILLSVALGYVVWRWGSEAVSPLAGNASLVAFAFCPTLIAHAHLATLDMGVAAFSIFTLYGAWCFLRRPTRAWAFGLGIATTLTLLTKFSGVIIVPIAVATALAARRWDPSVSKLPIPRIRDHAIVLALGAILVTAFCYGFLEIPRLMQGLKTMAQQSARGHNAFLMGHYSQRGWKSYYVIAFILKTPIPFLLVLFLSAVLAGRFHPRSLRFVLIWCCLPAVAYLVIGSFSHFQIGIRYLLTIYPLLCLWVGAAAAEALSHGGSWMWVIACLGVWYVLETALLYPRYISYFNEIAGGPSGGHRYLLDSNLDWGQGLKVLEQYLKKEGVETIYLSYFGCADPHIYGIHYRPVAMVSNVNLAGDRDRDPQKESKVLLVISATNRAGVYYDQHGVFRWTDKRTPVAVLMDSLYVYDVTADPELRRYLSVNP